MADRRRLLFAVLALVVVAGLVAWLLSGGSGTSSTKPPAAAAATGRTQSTLLINLKGSLGVAVDSALVAHDPANHDGAVVLVPSNVQTQVPGFGSMPFGQALSVGDPNAPTGALSDLIGVTVDGSWTLTQSALAALVDKLGGVTVAVDKDVTTTANETTTIVIPAGTQKLSGANAALFASFQATGETDQARLARFDAVLKQVLAGLPKTPADLSAMLASLGAGSSSSFAPARLATFLTGLAADSAAGTMTDQLLPVTALDTGSGQDAYTLDTVNTAKLVERATRDIGPGEPEGDGEPGLRAEPGRHAWPRGDRADEARGRGVRLRPGPEHHGHAERHGAVGRGDPRTDLGADRPGGRRGPRARPAHIGRPGR